MKNNAPIVAMATGLLFAHCALAEPPTPAATPTDSGALEEIVVTAEKRTSSAQSTPIAITVLTASALQDKGVTDVLHLNNAVPGLQVDSTVGQSIVYLRGIGPEINFPQYASAVPFFLDGAEVQRETLGTGLYDIAQLELLRGPQGTIYGRNAIGGAINITSNRPVDKFEAAGELETGNYSLFRSFGMVNIPALNDLFFRLAFQTVAHTGYASNGTNSLIAQSGRFEVLYQPSDRFDVLLTYTANHQSGLPPDSTPKGCLANLPPNLSPAPACGSTPHDSGLIDSDHPWNENQSVLANSLEENGFAASALANYRFDQGIVLTFIPSVAQARESLGNYIGGSRIFTAVENHQTSEELRLSNSAGTRRGELQWLVGLYNFAANAPFDARVSPATSQPVDFPTVAPGTPFFPPVPGGYVHLVEPRIDLRSYAAFGQARYALLDNLRITAGLRYSDDKENGETGELPNFVPLPITLTPHSQRESREDWKLGIEGDLSATSMLYANVQTGYLQGGFSLGGEFRPETLLNFSVGSKNRFLDNRLELNAELFYYKYKDFQLSFNNPSTGAQTEFNANLVHIYGADLSSQFRLTARDKIDATVSYLHTEIINAITPFPTYGDSASSTLVLPAGASLAGYQLIESPRWSTSLGYQHDWIVLGGALLSARVDDHHETSHYGDFTLNESSRSPPFFKTNFTLNFQSSSGRWHAGVYVYNIENAYSFTQGNPYSDAFIAPPRTFGAKAGFNF